MNSIYSPYAHDVSNEPDCYSLNNHDWNGSPYCRVSFGTVVELMALGPNGLMELGSQNIDMAKWVIANT